MTLSVIADLFSIGGANRRLSAKGGMGVAGESGSQAESVAEPRTFVIDVGGCSGWTLQRGNPVNTEFIRGVDDSEFNQIMDAVTFCRQNILRSPARLLVSSHQVWRGFVDEISHAQGAEHLSYNLFDELEGAFVGWLLIWRLVFDQMDHSVSARFGRESQERSMLKSARSNSYDSHQGYRIVEAMRNLVQHRDMPTFHVSKTRNLDFKSGKITEGVKYVLPVSWFLESSKCPAKVKAEFKDTPAQLLNVTDIVEDAMAGFREVFTIFVKIDHPESVEKINLLRQVFGEAHPGIPILLRIMRPEARAGARIHGGIQVQMERIDDMLTIVHEAPMGNPFMPADEDDA